MSRDGMSTVAINCSRHVDRQGGQACTACLAGMGDANLALLASSWLAPSMNQQQPLPAQRHAIGGQGRAAGHACHAMPCHTTTRTCMMRDMGVGRPWLPVSVVQKTASVESKATTLPLSRTHNLRG